MCYAIPGKVSGIDGKMVTVDYFGEKRKARNEFFDDLSRGDYVYAQGGFVIQKITPDEAQPILDTWEEFFFKLQETDLRLTREPGNMFQIANSVRQKHTGNSCCIHGIIEFSNHCRNDCLYCGLRKSNESLQRYRMGVEEIVEACEHAVNELGFKALVLQSGEDAWYTEEKLERIVEEVRRRCAVLLVMSIGEREKSVYGRLYEAGARGVLLRFESSSPSIYASIRPGHELEDRLRLIRELRDMGYLVMSGFLIGLPGQTEGYILKDIELTGSLGVEMFSFGPLIPHPGTPLSGVPRPALEAVLTVIARARMLYPDARIVVTTAVETLDPENGARQGLLSGGNSLMINVTPAKYRPLYEVYPGRAGNESGIPEKIKSVINLLHELGRAPTDLGQKGDSGVLQEKGRGIGL